MAEKYVKCDNDTKTSLCMSGRFICGNFLNEVETTYPEDKMKIGGELIEIKCAVYAFEKGCFIKYGYRETRNISENDIKRLKVI